MDVTELYRRLALGELSNLAMAEGGVISETKKATVILHANEALNHLHIRFLLKESTLIVEQSTDRTNYPLDSRYAMTNTDPTNTLPRFLNDLSKPFTDDVIKVMSVYDSAGDKLPMNDPSLFNSVFTPLPAVLQVPHPSEGQPLGVIYQAAHPKLSTTRPTQVLELPEFFVGALTAYIAYKVFSQMNTQENSAKGDAHLRTYESICVEATEQDLVTTYVSAAGTRFVNNGWV